MRLYEKFKSWRYRALLAFLLVTLAFAYTVGSLHNIQSDFNNEINQRQDQNCLLFENGHLNDVKRLRNTYAYLTALSPREKKEPLNQFVLKTLPETERQARIDDAPQYCDEPGFGLPEPDPKIPKRPAELNGSA